MKDKKLRICFIANGGLIHVKPYIEYMSKYGHEVFFIALSPSNFKNVKIYNVWGGKLSLSIGKLNYILSSFRAKKLIKKIKPDIVHAHYATSGGIAAFIINNKNTILTVHGSDVNLSINSFFWRFMLKAIFKRCNYINVVSKDLGLKVRSLNIPEEKIVTVNLGIEFDEFYSKRIFEISNFKNRELKIVCNRSFKEVYDHITLLKSLVLLKKTGISFKLTLIGDGPLKQDLKSFIIKHELGKNVNFTGYLDQDSQLKIFNENNVYVSTSLSDGTSLSLLEGIAAGLYPIVSKITANIPWIENSRTGFLFATKQENELFECLVNFTKLDGNNLQTAINNGQLLVNKYGNRSINMNIIQNLYLKLV